MRGCGGRIRTADLRVMSPTSYHCSTPRPRMVVLGRCRVKRGAPASSATTIPAPMCTSWQLSAESARAFAAQGMQQPGSIGGLHQAATGGAEDIGSSSRVDFRCNRRPGPNPSLFVGYHDPQSQVGGGAWSACETRITWAGARRAPSRRPRGGSRGGRAAPGTGRGRAPRDRGRRRRTRHPWRAAPWRSSG